MQAASTKPEWLKVRPPSGDNYKRLKVLSSELSLHTVCEEAHCPNIAECWGGGTATFMLLGDVCTRGCRFCAVKSGNPNKVVDELEPLKIALALKKMNLSYVVLTSVDRDDLPDGGAAHFAQTILETKKHNPSMLIEVLTPDFRGDLGAVERIVRAHPDVFAHNIETVERLQAKARDLRASYVQSLNVLKSIKEMDPSIYTKSSIMLGLGERDEEVVQSIKDLRAAGVDILAIGQYLRPSSWHLKVEEYVHPSKFEEFRKIGESFGFKFVASGPLVRTSYRAGEFFMENLIRKERGAS
ncbi:MAG: lipoyl synthase [Thaumarchaeota archaeon]|nr:lipoyl synthase [Nitrososphaerota archaeon]MDG6907126.1 lipoyl synthase [Nitrososphaerota archaeon]